jgi:chromosome partitioning protein
MTTGKRCGRKRVRISVVTTNTGITIPAEVASAPEPVVQPATGPARVIVFGNEKGGSGKSTVAMHVVVGLLRGGHKVGTIDVDSRQATLTRYLENRAMVAETKGFNLPLPEHRLVMRSDNNPDEDAERFNQALDSLARSCDAVVIDTPGSDAPLSRLAHSYADTLVTPMNDSFVDLDLLAKVDPETFKVICPSAYAEMVWDQRKKRMARDRGSIDWIVVRNRLSALDTRNKRNMEKVLGSLAKRIGFRTAPGFGDRVIFREMFLSGLTLLDLRETGTKLTLSHIAARQEVRDLLAAVVSNTAPAAAPA